MGISPKLLYRWQQAQLVVEVGSAQVARDPEVRQLRAQQPRSFVPRATDSDPSVRAAPNLLLGQPAPLPRTRSG